MKRFTESPGRLANAGFTMVEMIAVLLVLAVLAAFVLPRVDTEQPTAINDLNVLRAHIRFAQIKAMGDVVSWGLNINGNTYTLERDGATSTTVNLPGVNGVTHQFESDDLSIAAIQIAFDPRGRPLTPTGNATATSDQVLTVSPSDYGNIVITQQTGFLQ